eukprot:scaffold11302_cov57-Phaeocystis_antarctica.AAC.4
MIDASLHLAAACLHEAFSNRSGVPLDHFELYYRGKRLEGEAALASWGVEKDATIEVKMRGRGGMTPIGRGGSPGGRRRGQRSPRSQARAAEEASVQEASATNLDPLDNISTDPSNEDTVKDTVAPGSQPQVSKGELPSSSKVQGGLRDASSKEASKEASKEEIEEESEKTTTDHKARLCSTADELLTLRAAGLEPRKGVPGLFLRQEKGLPIVPPNGIKLEGRAHELASAMRDELATHLREKGTKDLPTSSLLDGTKLADLKGAWLQGADLREAQLQKATLRAAQLQGANLGKAQLEEAFLIGAQLQEADLREAQLQKANLHDAQLLGANLGGAHLEWFNLSEAQRDEANLSGVQLLLQGGIRATADELLTLRAAGLEPRKGVPGLFLRREKGLPIVPPDVIKLKGRAHELASAMRDELATHLREKGTKDLPTVSLVDGTTPANLT